MTAAQRLQNDLELRLEGAKKAAAIEVIRLRVRSSEPVKPVEYHPDYFVRPEKGYRLPHLGQWSDWVESRRGQFMLSSVLHVLCICCGIPVPVSSGEKTVIGSKGRKSVMEGNGGKITVGCLVKWKQYEEQTHNVYNPLLPDSVEVTEEKVVRLVTVKGLGCTACQRQMVRVTADTMAEYRKQTTEYIRKYTALETAIREYRRTTPDPDPTLCRMYGELPKEPTPYILVDPKIDVEKTVQYFLPGYGAKETLIPKAGPSVPTYAADVQLTASILYRDLAYCLNPGLLVNQSPVWHTSPEGTVSEILPEPVQRPEKPQPIPTREPVSHRIFIPLYPVGICHHARGVTPVTRTGRRPGVY